MRVFEASFAPLDEAVAVIASHPFDWVDKLPSRTVEFDSEKFALGWIERNSFKALHGHFVLREIIRGECDEEVSRKVIELDA